MPLTYLKTAPGAPPQAAADISDTVREMLDRMRAGGSEVALDYARSLDKWTGEITLSRVRIVERSPDSSMPRVAPKKLKMKQ